MDTLRSLFEKVRNYEATRSKKAQYGVHSITGKKSGKLEPWINQDNYAIFEATDRGHAIQMFVIFDGHGPFGHLVSERCRDRIPQLLSNANYDLHKAFALMHDDLESSDLDVTLSGTTCVAVSIEGCKRMTIASVGDSLAVMGMRQSKGSFSPYLLNSAHKPDRPDELERLKKAGGKVFSHLPETSNALGPSRVWYQNAPESASMTGLAMSRSLGDTSAHRVGVSHIPELDCNAIDTDDDFIIMASDGVWDMLDGKEAIRSIQKLFNADHSDSNAWDPKEAATVICETARKRWEEISPGAIDDITCIVIKLQTS